MHLTFRAFHTLPQEAVTIRTQVFVKEQGFQEEFDVIDETAVHLVMFDGEKAVAVCRYFYDSAIGAYAIGRIAVSAEYRGKHYGAAVVKEAERRIAQLGAKQTVLAAQLRARGFYEKQGYIAYGEEFSEEGCPHIWMKKQL